MDAVARVRSAMRGAVQFSRSAFFVYIWKGVSPPYRLLVFDWSAVRLGMSLKCPSALLRSWEADMELGLRVASLSPFLLNADEASAESVSI